MASRATNAGRTYSQAIGLLETLLVCSLLAVGSGCTTTRSRLQERTAEGSWSAAAPASPGIPVTIRVPTHVEVWVYEKLYFQRVADQLQQVPLQRPVRWVEVRGVETNQVVTVDWKRPFSGSLDYSAKIGSDQYFDALNAKLSDTTIEDVTAAVQALGAVPTRAAGGDASALLEEDRLLAYRRFDLADCEVEAQIVDFVAAHLAAATECVAPAPQPLGPALSEIPRAADRPFGAAVPTDSAPPPPEGTAAGSLPEPRAAPRPGSQ